MSTDQKLAVNCRTIMGLLPASLPGRPMRRGQRWDLQLPQRDIDIIYAALSQHEYYCQHGHHEDAQPSGTVQRLAARIGLGTERVNEIVDPYAGYSLAERKFAEDMDLWTLEHVIVRVMTEIDRRRRKYLGGIPKMLKRRAARTGA